MSEEQTNPVGKPPPARGLAHLARSCRYSWQGFCAACKEAAFRQELACGVILVPLAWLLPIPVMHSVLLTIVWVGLLLTELLNTAIEAVIDLVSPGFHPLAGRAKDLASAAVTCAIVINALAWAGVLWCRWGAH